VNIRLLLRLLASWATALRMRHLALFVDVYVAMTGSIGSTLAPEIVRGDPGLRVEYNLDVAWLVVGIWPAAHVQPPATLGFIDWLVSQFPKNTTLISQ